MSDLEDEFERVGKEYQQKIPEKLHDIVVLFESIDVVFWSRGNLAPLIRKLHGLRGSAGTFGFTRIAESAGKIEQDLALIAAQPNGPSQASWQVLGENIRHLSRFGLIEQQPDKARDTPTQKPRNNLHSPMVDLIEDDQEEAEFITEVLRCAGFRVRHFGSGEAYKESWSAESYSKPDAIIMDMMLESGDLAGVETVKAIQPDRVVSPVIFLSQRDDIQARLKAFEAGATRYLVKPVDTAHLVNLLDALTGRQPEDPYRVLLVDDEPNLLEAQAVALRMSGMSVKTLSDPMETLTALKLYQPDVLILDVYMPEVTGPEIAAIVRDSDDYLNLPILFLSSEQDISQQLMALNLGGDDFLVKPLRQDHLVAAVSARARRARQNAIVSQRMTALTAQLHQLSRTFDEHCIRIALNSQLQIIGLNQRFERVTGLDLYDFESQYLEKTQWLSCQGQAFGDVLTQVAEAGRWQGRLVLDTKAGEKEIETTILKLEAPGAPENGQYWILGTVVGDANDQ